MKSTEIFTSSCLYMDAWNRPFNRSICHVSTAAAAPALSNHRLYSSHFLHSSSSTLNCKLQLNTKTRQHRTFPLTSFLNHRQRLCVCVCVWMGSWWPLLVTWKSDVTSISPFHLVPFNQQVGYGQFSYLNYPFLWSKIVWIRCCWNIFWQYCLGGIAKWCS